MKDPYLSARERLSANFYLAPSDLSVVQFMKWARVAGAKGVGLTVAATSTHSPDELKAMAANEGLFISTLNSAGYFLFGCSGPRAAQEELNNRLIDAAARMGAQRLVVITGGVAASGRTLEEARAYVSQSLAELDKAAGAAGVRLALEPIHPVGLTNKGCVNSIAQAVAVVRTLPHTDLVIDLFHSYWDVDIWRLIDIAGDKVACVQVCNWNEPHPDAKPIRDLPAAGPMDVEGWLRKMIDDGYAGPIEFEMFDRDRGGRPVQALLVQAFKELNQILSSPNCRKVECMA